MRFLISMLCIFAPVMVQGEEIRPLARWQTGAVEYVLENETQAPCRLHLSRFSLDNGHRILAHRVSDLRYFNLETRTLKGQVTLLWKLDLPDTPTSPEARYRNWKLSSMIRDGYQRINTVWQQLGNEIQAVERESRVQKIARALAARNKKGEFGRFFHSNYREIYFLYGGESYRFLPAQGFSLPMQSSARAQNITGLLTGIKSRHCTR
jgi:hypothetical protein